jgi:hypothetical protein
VPLGARQSGRCVKAHLFEVRQRASSRISAGQSRSL